MGELGTILREARENQGLSLAQLEEITRIRRVFLEALEEERLDALPGDVYAKGFIRNYARALSLEPEELLAAYRTLTGSPSTPHVPVVLDEPLTRRTHTPIGATIFLSIMVILLLLVAGWYIYRRFYLGVDPWPFDTGPFASLIATRTASAPPLTLTPVSTSSDSAQNPSVTATLPLVVGETATQQAPAPTQVTQMATSAPTPATTPTQVNRVRVEAHVLATTYLEIIVDEGPTLVETLNMGNDRAWEAERVISLHIGNAGGLRLMVNGVEVPPLGQQGQVIDVEYSLDTLPQG